MQHKLCGSMSTPRQVLSDVGEERLNLTIPRSEDDDTRCRLVHEGRYRIRCL